MTFFLYSLYIATNVDVNVFVCINYFNNIASIYSIIPLSDHSPGATMPLLRPLFYSPDFSPMLSTVRLFYSATIPLFQFATTDFSPKPHMFPILRPPHRRRTRPHCRGTACGVCLITLANQCTTLIVSLSRL